MEPFVTAASPILFKLIHHPQAHKVAMMARIPYCIDLSTSGPHAALFCLFYVFGGYIDASSLAVPLEGMQSRRVSTRPGGKS